MAITYKKRFFEKVRLASTRQGTPEHIRGRLLKNQEELGEVSEAWLNLTDGINRKGKTLLDLQEELVDVYLVSVDAFLTFSSLISQRDAAMGIELEELATQGEFSMETSGDFFRPFAQLSKLQGKSFERVLNVTGVEPLEVLQTELGFDLFAMQQLAGQLLFTAYPGQPVPVFECRALSLENDLLRKITKWTTTPSMFRAAA